MITSSLNKNAEHIFVLAEIGINHDGSVSKAKELIDASIEAGADGVKFQYIIPEKLVNPVIFDEGICKENPVINIFKKYQLNESQFIEIAEYCQKRGTQFLCTAFDETGLDFIDGLTTAHKIASGDITHIPLLKEAGSKKKPVILSTGMADIHIIRQAVNAIKDGGGREIILLHCVSCYPPEDNELNLRSITSIINEFGYPTGFSDHSTGITAAIAAYALGARFIEKHVTFNSKDPGADHAMSIEMPDFETMIKELRRMEKMMGSGVKKPCPREIEISRGAFRGVYAARNIKKGTVFNEKDFILVRPASRFKPADIYTIIGKTVLRDIAEGEPLREGDF